jgi:hypothetical protein
VGYAGLGTKVHDSGMTSRSGRITKAGRRDLCVVLIEAAKVAANTHPHLKAELARLQPRLVRRFALHIGIRQILGRQPDGCPEDDTSGIANESSRTLKYSSID